MQSACGATYKWVNVSGISDVSFFLCYPPWIYFELCTRSFFVTCFDGHLWKQSTVGRHQNLENWSHWCICFFFLCFCKSRELGGSKTASQCSSITDAATLAEPAALQTKCTCRPETLLKFCIIKDATNGQMNKETLMTQDWPWSSLVCG